MDSKRFWEVAILLGLLMTLLGIVTLVGKSEEVIVDPNYPDVDESIILVAESGVIKIVYCEICQSKPSELTICPGHTEPNEANVLVFGDDFDASLMDIEPNEPSVIEWKLEPDDCIIEFVDTNELKVYSSDENNETIDGVWICESCIKQFNDLKDLSSHSCVEYVIDNDPIDDIKSRLESIEQSLAVLAEGIVANDDNIRYLVKVLTKYIDKVHFEGKQERPEIIIDPIEWMKDTIPAKGCKHHNQLTCCVYGCDCWSCIDCGACSENSIVLDSKRIIEEGIKQ